MILSIKNQSQQFLYGIIIYTISTMNIKGYLILILCLATSPLLAQNTDETKSEEAFYPHRLTMMMANSHIPAADQANGGKTFFVVPTWGFNYDYWFTRKWAIGLHNDLVLQQYKIEEQGDNKVIERSFPVSMCAMGLFKPANNWTLLAGFGRELEKHESFNMINIGVEYGIELPNEWELSFNFNYENKLEIYDSWIFGIGFSKFLERK